MIDKLTKVKGKRVLLVAAVAVTIALLMTAFPIHVEMPGSGMDSATIGTSDNRIISIGTGLSGPRITIGTPVHAQTADYTCDGTSDDVEFQAALDALPATGGQLFVLAGTYDFDVTVTRAIADVSIVGIGASVHFQNDGVDTIFDAGGNNWVFSNFEADAGGLSMGATTDWMWLYITIGSTHYPLRTDNYSSEDFVGGPGSSTDEAIARFDGATGKLIQDYTSNAPTISNTGDMTVDGDATVDNLITAGTVDGVDVSVHDTATTGVHGVGANTLLHTGNLGSTVQDWDTELDEIAALTDADGNFIVGSVSGWVAESGNTAKTSLGVGTGDSPQFDAVNVGHGSDTTLSRSGAGDLQIETSIIYRAGGTDVPVTDGGTGASDTSTARTNLGLAIGTNVEAWDADLDELAALADTDSNFIVGSATGWVVESGATVRTSLGLIIGTDVAAQTHASQHAVSGSDTIFPADPDADQYLMWDDAPTGELVWSTPGGGGDVTGPGSSTDNAIVRFDSTSGKIIQDYTSNPPTISDTGDMTIDGDATVDNLITAGNVDGRDVSADGTKLDGIDAGADVTGSNAPQAHAASHQNAGGDEISVVGLSGLLADDQHVLDAEVQAIKLDDFATPDDNTDLNASLTEHGLLLKLGGGTTNFLRADGTWAAPAGGGDVTGPASSVNNAIVRFDGITGKIIQDYTSGAPTISDTGEMTVNGNIIVTGTVDGVDISAHDTATTGVHGVGAETILHTGNIGSTVQAWDTELDDIAALSDTDSNFIVGSATGWVAETGATVRASLGLTIDTDVPSQSSFDDHSARHLVSGADTIFPVDPDSDLYLMWDDAPTGELVWSTPGGGGDVTGPGSSTDEAIARFSGVTGKVIQDYTSGAPTISDTGDITVSGDISVTGTVDSVDVSAHDTATTGVHGVGAETILHTGNIGSSLQAWDDDLDDLAALTPTDSYFIVGDNSDWVAETGATARTSLGLTIDTDVPSQSSFDDHSTRHLVSAADTIFPTDPDADQYLMWDDVPGELIWSTPGGGGDVTGPSSATDLAIVRFDGTSGKLIQDYTSDAPTISDTGDITVSGDISVTGSVDGIDVSAHDTASTGVHGVGAETILHTGDLGSTVQDWDQELDEIAALSDIDSNFIVGSASGWVAESGDTVRTSLGLAIDTDVPSQSSFDDHSARHLVSATDTIFPTDPNSDQYLMWDDVPGELIWSTPGGGGDVTGPASATEHAIVRFDGTSGKLIQDYTSNAPTISDTGDVTVDGDLTADNIITAGNVDGVDVSVHDTATTGVHGVGAETILHTGDIGSSIQAWDTELDDIAGLSDADSNFIVGSVGGWVAESGATVRTSLGLTIDTDIPSQSSFDDHSARHLVGAADTIFPADPDADQYLMWDDAPTGELVWSTPGGSGDVTGPGSSTDNAIVRFHATTGKVIQDYTSNPPTISDTGDMTIDGDATVDNLITAGQVDGVDVSAHVTGDVVDADYNAQTVMVAVSDDTPVATTVTEQNLIGRITGGNVGLVAIGTADNSIVQIDGTAANTNYAKFTTDGLVGRAFADVLGDLSGQATSAFDWNGQDFTNGGVIFLTEQAEAETDVAGKGQIWVNTAEPNELWFTNDVGTDVQLGVGGADEKVKIDSGATADYIGATGSDGVLWTTSPITYTDNVNYITLGVQDAAADDTTKGAATFEADDFDDASGKIDLAVSVLKQLTGDSGTATATAHSISITGGAGITTTASGTDISIAGDDATTSTKGIASFNTESFTVSGGAVSLILDQTPVDGEVNEPISSDWAYEDSIVTLTFVIDGGGSAITTGEKGHLEIPFDCTLMEWTLVADQSGSIVIDIWDDTYANFPPDDADTMPGTGKEPTLSSAQKNQDTDITDWTDYTLTTDDIIAFNVDSCSTITRVTLSLTARKT